ncbi:TPA: hypothetical protein N0F65_010309 [Lagenidium giganteum]|uniref:Glycosyl transferase CAP10 domain-containing protein n=1 Tax=Lagenidium giganteum TaxID=4803 RepID=A0AAV2Z3Z5_9STRA|nr:TPA: hypothetical protein N0F65_010309 [Lagenidium giganteum]
MARLAAMTTTTSGPLLRGIFAFEDEDTPEWRDVVLKGGGLPKFTDKEQCEAFVRRHCWRGSNPDFPLLQHVFSMLVDWRQIEEILIPKMDEYDRRFPPQPPSAEPTQNRFFHGDGAGVAEGINERLNLPFHRQTTRESTLNTLKYLFFHMRCGIFVMIRHRQVVMFVPFANKDYENNWGEQIRFDCSNGQMAQYYREKQKFYRRENIIPNPSKWWANGNIICNEHCRHRSKEHETQYWGDQFLVQLRDMLEDACKHRDIPDCEFFINKRDYPHLKATLSEPYGFLWDRDDRNPAEDIPLTRCRYESYAPIMSFYISKRFADIPFPCSEDWEAATGLVFPQSFSHSHCDACTCSTPSKCENEWKCFCRDGAYGGRQRHGVENARDLFTAVNFQKFSRPWEDKQNTAFFRGSATGGGTTVDTNQRLHLAHLSNTWKRDPEFNGEAAGDHIPFLNAEVTTWNMRDKKIAGKPMTYLRSHEFIFKAGRQHFIPIYEQTTFKYILYVEGHCAANRYAFLMRLGSVILKVESRCVADEMWYFSTLKPFEDHVPVKADLSDLAEKIQWCRDNDDQCRKIAARANELYASFVSKEGIRDYMELICHGVAQRFQAGASTDSWQSDIDGLKPSLSNARRNYGGERRDWRRGGGEHEERSGRWANPRNEQCWQPRDRCDREEGRGGFSRTDRNGAGTLERPSSGNNTWARSEGRSSASYGPRTGDRTGNADRSWRPSACRVCNRAGAACTCNSWCRAPEKGPNERR